MKNLTAYSDQGVHEHEVYECGGNDQKVILVFPTWAGISDFERSIAAKLNKAGHNAIVMDFFGRETDLSDLENRRRAIAPFLADTRHLQSHLRKLLEPICASVNSDTARLGVIGFCLGGLCAIHAGLQEAQIDRAVSFHGLLKLPPAASGTADNTRFLILNGSRDPMVPGEEILSAIRFFDDHDLDMTFVSLSGTYHSFMVPEADNREAGVLYCERSAVRSWQLCEDFLK